MRTFIGDIFDAQLEELLAAMDLDQKIEVLFTLPPIGILQCLSHTLHIRWDSNHRLIFKYKDVTEHKA